MFDVLYYFVSDGDRRIPREKISRRRFRPVNFATENYAKEDSETTIFIEVRIIESIFVERILTALLMRKLVESECIGSYIKMHACKTIIGQRLICRGGACLNFRNLGQFKYNIIFYLTEKVGDHNYCSFSLPWWHCQHIFLKSLSKLLLQPQLSFHHPQLSPTSTFPSLSFLQPQLSKI